MSNPDVPGREPEPAEGADPETEVLSTPDAVTDAALPSVDPGERRFTAPSGMDAGSTQIIGRGADPVTEIIDMGVTTPRVAVPQEIPARGDVPMPRIRRRWGGWGWLLAFILVVAALAAVAVLGTLLLSRGDNPKASQEELVRATIQNFDGAIQRGDLATLRGITCGETADGYNKYDERRWADIHARVAAAQQYPVVASIDEVVVNGEHAEANVTSFLAYDPSTRSTRSFDLEYRDEQWKICQAAGN